MQSCGGNTARPHVRACEHDDSEVLGSTDLLWYGQGLTVQHLATLGRCLGTSALSHLEQLNLSVNRFGAEGAIALFGALGRGSARLTVLDLTGGVMGAAPPALAAALPVARCRGRILTLGRNEIGDADWSRWRRRCGAAGAEEVYLHGNQIGDAGWTAAVQLGREQLKGLQTLNLGAAQIDDAGCTI